MRKILFLLIIPASFGSNETSNIFNISEFTNKSEFTKTLAPGKIDIHYRSLNISDALDLARISISLPNSKEFEIYGKDPIIEMMVSNGRDSLTLNLPVIQNNGDLAWDDGKLLNPLIPNDFGSQKKHKNQPQTLFITVKSRLNVEILYKINIRFLDRSQYVVRWKDGDSSHQYLNQHLTFVKPIGYYINVVEQEITNLKITLLSEDDVCATLVTVPNNLSIYENSYQLEKFERRLTLTRRADIYFSTNELSQLTDFRVFVFINRNDQECDPEAPNQRKDQNKAKKLSFFFEKIDKSSYFLPIFVMFLVFVAPIFGVVGYFSMTKGNKNTIRSGGSGVLIQLHDSYDPENTQAPELPEIQEVSTQIKIQPKILQTSSMLKYPLAIILPIFMHAISEYHKFTQTSMANRDEICFHNLACAKPYWEFRAFNNILSNLGYFVCGAVFVGFTVVKKRAMISKNSGVYDCSDLDVLIGFLLILQSIGSSAYHICPNHLAFQFDTPCIQIISCLIIIRQSIIRRKSPSPHISNAIFVAIFVANFAISAFSNWILLRFFIAIFHSLTIFAVIRRKKENFLVFSMIFGILNGVLGLSYLIFTKIVHLNQILTFLAIFNCTAYLLYYTWIKIWKNEEILKKSAILGAVSVVFWTMAMVFYLWGDIDWTISPAKSRALNKPCLIFDFFGSHDLWHVSSAFATLFTFFYVSLIDDNLSNVPRNCLNVF